MYMYVHVSLFFIIIRIISGFKFSTEFIIIHVPLFFIIISIYSLLYMYHYSLSLLELFVVSSSVLSLLSLKCHYQSLMCHYQWFQVQHILLHKPFQSDF